MKIGYKIFLGILTVSMAAFGISSAILIADAHQNNLNVEMERSRNEFGIMESSLQSAMEEAMTAGTSNTTVVARYSEYYSGRKIYFALAQEQEILYDGVQEEADLDYSDMLEVKADEYAIHVQKSGSDRYIVLATGMENGNVLFYIRDISGIYSSQQGMIVKVVLLGVTMIFVLALVSWLIANIITKPLSQLSISVRKMEAGDFDISLKEGGDELGELARSFMQMAQTVRSREQGLEESVCARQTFIDDMSHEMNTPLTAIQGYAQILETGNLSEEQRQHSLSCIQKETRRIRQMHDRLRTLSLLGGSETEMENLDLKQILEEVREELGGMLNDKKIRFYLVSDPDSVRMLADGTLMHLLFSNLIRNAIHYSNENTEISCAVKADGKEIRVEVSDQGIGIPEDKTEQVFEPFYRIDKSRSRKTGGSGLGLAICKRIVELHNGSISIHSVPGAGTTVRVSFPEN